MTEACVLEPAAVPADQQAVDALLDELDDLFADPPADDTVPAADADAEILAAVTGVFDTSSAYYQPDMGRQLALFDQVAQRLATLACGHDHVGMAGSLDGVSDMSSGRQLPHGHGLFHDDDDEADDEDKPAARTPAPAKARRRPAAKAQAPSDTAPLTWPKLLELSGTSPVLAFLFKN